jgi:hypothetical protein
MSGNAPTPRRPLKVVRIPADNWINEPPTGRLFSFNHP